MPNRFDQDPTAVRLSHLHTLAFPDGNYGWGVYVKPAPGGRWYLSPAPEPEKRRADHRRRTKERLERDAAREARRHEGRAATSAEQWEDAFDAMKDPEVRQDPPVILDDVVVSAHEDGEGRWRVQGHWNLAGAWRNLGVADWPFGGVHCGWDEVPPDTKLLSCLPGGGVFIPTIPTHAAMEEYLVGRDIQVPEWVCGCGRVHQPGGVVVGLEVKFIAPGSVAFASRDLIVRAHGHLRFRAAHPTHALDLRLCALIDHVEPGGYPATWWNRHHGDAEAAAKAEEQERIERELLAKTPSFKE